MSSLNKTQLYEILQHAGHFLPAQAPLEVFVHHNTLHAFQHLPFHQALDKAAQKLGARCYLSEGAYRTAFKKGRITEADVRATLRDQAAQLMANEGEGAVAAQVPWPTTVPTPFELRLLIQLHGLRETGTSGLRWLLTETGADHHFRADLPAAAKQRLLEAGKEAAVVGDLWQTCLRLVQRPGAVGGLETAEHVAGAASDGLRFPRELLIAVSDEDPNELVHPVLIPLCAAFLDRGQAHFSMPGRGDGFYLAWSHIAVAGRALRSAWERRLGDRIRQHLEWNAEDAVLSLLSELGITGEEAGEFIEQLLLQLPSWAGMFQRLEGSTQQVGLAMESRKVRLIDFLAVRLSLDVLAYQDIAERMGYEGTLRELLPYLRTAPRLNKKASRGDIDSAWLLFNLAQLAGISAPVLRECSDDVLRVLFKLIKQMSEEARLRIWHESYEYHYREDLIRGLFCSVARPIVPTTRRFQVICCIDDRMESFRRHLEECNTDVETFGAAGFFNLAIAFQGIDDPSTFPLCPVVVKPQHKIAEEPAEQDASLFQRRLRRRRHWHNMQARFDSASRSLILGSILTAIAGFVATVPLLLNVFLPKFAARLRRRVIRNLLPEVRTRLQQSGDAGLRASATAELYIGFSLEEKASRVGALLENIGLVRDFAQVIVVFGHDSSSVNNPHFAAYSCGACGGRSGGPNARLFASMANDSDVRQLLRERGIDIPETTLFVGGVHDTCADSLTLYDEAVPDARRADWDAVRQRLQDGVMRHAHERTRRFASASPDYSLDEALEHVEERAADLSQARPELGHATNASCVVGRRVLTRGLFLDRRAFLVSYDPTIDDGGTILERILLAVSPVCAGINLEYFFSKVDNERLGAGTKLPHNVTGLIAVMNGASSDLRTGLPRQMIEVHEPVRLQLVLDASPDVVQGIIDRQLSLAELIKNEWVQVITLTPNSADVHIYRAGRGFVRWTPPVVDSANNALLVPHVRSSSAWYYGKRSFVPPALIEPPEEKRDRP